MSAAAVEWLESPERLREPQQACQHMFWTAGAALGGVDSHQKPGIDTAQLHADGPHADFANLWVKHGHNGLLPADG